MNIKKIVKFFFELGALKKIKHNGWYLTGVKDPDSIAEHALLAAQIGYVLAVMEGNANPEKVACILMIHDNAEIRIGDQHKVAARYYSNKEAEHRAFDEQLDNLGDIIKKKWHGYFLEYEDRNTPEGIIAKDADWLEMAFFAKELFDTGYKGAWEWIKNVERAVETKSAKKLIDEMKKTEFTDWYKGLKKMTYKKL